MKLVKDHSFIYNLQKEGEGMEVHKNSADGCAWFLRKMGGSVVFF